MQLVKIELPFPSELSAQQGGHWTKKADSIRRLKEMACYLVKDQIAWAPKLNRARIDYEFIVADNRQRDEGNLIYQCKPYVDGLVLAGVIQGDHWQVLSTGKISTRIAEKGEKPAVKMTISKL